MKDWKKEMINMIMDGSDDINKTLAELITQGFSGVDIYLDNLAQEIMKQSVIDAEELKDYLENEILDHKEL